MDLGPREFKSPWPGQATWAFWNEPVSQAGLASPSPKLHPTPSPKAHQKAQPPTHLSVKTLSYLSNLHSIQSADCKAMSSGHHTPTPQLLQPLGGPGGIQTQYPSHSPPGTDQTASRPLPCSARRQCLRPHLSGLGCPGIQLQLQPWPDMVWGAHGLPEGESQVDSGLTRGWEETQQASLSTATGHTGPEAPPLIWVLLDRSLPTPFSALPASHTNKMQKDGPLGVWAHLSLPHSSPEGGPQVRS